MSQLKRERTCFESDLAAAILNHPESFPAVAQLSNAIVELLTREENKQLLLRSSILDDSVSSQLYSNSHFGKIAAELDHCPTSQVLYTAICQSLKNSQQNLQLSLHIHQIFMQKIYDKLPSKKIIHASYSELPWHKLTVSERVAKKLLNESPETIKKVIVSQVFTPELFAQIARIKFNETGLVTSTIGIAEPSQCADLKKTEVHQTVLGVFSPKDDSKWAQEIASLGLPFVAGPSGHTGSALLAVLMLGNFNEEQQKQYITATIGILTGGGYHSVHEIMRVAEQVKIPYKNGHYWHFLPQNFINSEAYAVLVERYPDYLPNSEYLHSHTSSANSLYSFFKSAKDYAHSSFDRLLHLSLNTAEKINTISPLQNNESGSSYSVVKPEIPCTQSNTSLAIEAPPTLACLT